MSLQDLINQKKKEDRSPTTAKQATPARAQKSPSVSDPMVPKGLTPSRTGLGLPDMSGEAGRPGPGSAEESVVSLQDYISLTRSKRAGGGSKWGGSQNTQVSQAEFNGLKQEVVDLKSEIQGLSGLVAQLVNKSDSKNPGKK